MSVDSFLMLTPEQFAGSYSAFLERIKAEAEQREQLAWNIGRWQVWRTLCPPTGKSLSVLDMIELPGDERIKMAKVEKIKPSTEDRFKSLAKKWQ